MCLLIKKYININKIWNSEKGIDKIRLTFTIDKHESSILELQMDVGMHLEIILNRNI